MRQEIPPSLPKRSSASMRRRVKIVIGLTLIPAILYGTLILLRMCGLAYIFHMPTGGMAPAVSTGDHIMTEGFSYHFREPRRGDIAVFKTDRNGLLPRAQIYAQRIAGEPGDRVRISEGKLFINDKQVSLHNAEGEIVYNLPRETGSYGMQTDVTVPANCYFMLGDNSAKSSDSRYWGSVPRSNIIGRISFCYWPIKSIGFVR